MTADLVFVGGRVETVTGGAGEAVAVTDSRISAIGSRDEVLDGRRRSTEIVDLAGRTLLPGLVEPHSHPDLCGQLYSWVDVSGFTHAHVSGVEAAIARAVRRRALRRSK